MKNLNYILISLVLIFTFNSVIGQVEDRDGLMVVNSYPGGIVETREMKKSEIPEGSFYVNNDWQVGSITLSDDRIIDNVPLKCNLKDDQLIILDNDESAKVVRFENVKKFIWFDTDKQENVSFINSLELGTKGSDLVGFLQILVEGDLNLYGYYTLKLIKGNYSVTHDAGQLNDRYIVEKKYYLENKISLTQASKKKEIKNMVADKGEVIDQYIKKNGTKFNKEEDLISLIEYYNTL